MELWIRSQDRETLCKVDDIHIEEQSLCTDTHLKIWLGQYKTKERAVEVLDEIQHRLITLCDSMNRKLYVYEMPKE